MKKITTILITLISISACVGGYNEVNKIYPLSQTVPVDNISELIAHTDTIPLKDSVLRFFPFIKKMLIDNDGNFILADEQNGVIVYDKDGTFVRQIGSEGRGRGEYTSLISICMTEDCRQIYLLQTGSVLKFNLPDGEFVNKVDIPISNYDDICPAPDGGFILFASNPENESDFSTDFFALSRFDSTGRCVEQMLPRKDYVVSMGIFTQTAEKQYFMRPQEGSDTLFRIAGGRVGPFCRIDFEEQAIPHKYVFTSADNTFEGFKNYMKSSYYKLPIYFHNTAGYLLFTAAGPEAAQTTFIINHSTKKGYRWTTPPRTPSPLTIHASDSNSFYALIHNDAPRILRITLPRFL